DQVLSVTLFLSIGLGEHLQYAFSSSGAFIFHRYPLSSDTHTTSGLNHSPYKQAIGVNFSVIVYILLKKGELI
ncbi:hypothetical protein AB6D63_00005, partial [Vibrio splendidus]